MFNTIAHQVFNTIPDRAVAIAGGDINRAARLDIQGTAYFVKYNAGAPPGFFEAEAHGLNLLRGAGAFRVPHVVASADTQDNVPAYMVLEWVERGVPSHDFPTKLGRALAELHRVTAETFGLERDNYIGRLPQANRRTSDWVEFYRDQRLLPQIQRAKRKGSLPPKREAHLTRLLERLDHWLDGVQHLPSLLHGDLWAGNFMAAADDQPCIYDPAAYYGDREIELAFTELFGGFPSGFYTAYREAYPLQPGYEERRALYQLYPLLVHLNLFGETYGGAVDSVCGRYV